MLLNDDSPSPCLPVCTPIIVQNTSAHEAKGRGVYATQDIQANCELMVTDYVPISVITYEHWRDVCAHCFHYDWGVSLPVKCKATLHAFCSHKCNQAWLAQLSLPMAFEVWEIVDRVIRSRSQRALSPAGRRLRRKFNERHILPCLWNSFSQRWLETERLAFDIIVKRCNRDTHETHAPTPSLPGKKNFYGSNGQFFRVLPTLNLAKHDYTKLVHCLSWNPAPDNLRLLLTGWLAVAKNSEFRHQLLQLASHSSPYASVAEFEDFRVSFLILCLILPIPTLKSVMFYPDSCTSSMFTRNSIIWNGQLIDRLVGVMAANSFGIRSYPDSNTILAYGLWPYASYFNHSCNANVRKVRHGRTWRFFTHENVRSGAELCINYLGPTESFSVVSPPLSLVARWERLWHTWRFVCKCDKCEQDLAMLRTVVRKLKLACVNPDWYLRRRILRYDIRCYHMYQRDD